MLRKSPKLFIVFSRRSSHDQSPNALAALLAETGAPELDLTLSNPTRVGLGSPGTLLSLLERAQATSLRYAPEPFGEIAARKAVALRYDASPDDVMLTASTSEAYGFLFKLLCDAGDAVLVPAPSYPLFEHLAELEGVQALPYRLAYDGAWHLDLQSVRALLTAKTRAIVIVSPNNPTGHFFSASELEALAGFGLPLISDEVFAAFPLGSQTAPRAYPDQVLSFRLDGLSKRAGAPQLKLAWTVLSGPERARSEARSRLSLIADTYLSVATAVQQALPAILDACPAITASISERCSENLAALTQELDGSAVTLLRPQAGWSAVLRLPAVQSEEELVLGLLRRQRVLVQPGWFYDFEREPYAVVSLLSEPAVLRQGIQRLLAHVQHVSA